MITPACSRLAVFTFRCCAEITQKRLDLDLDLDLLGADFPFNFAFCAGRVRCDPIRPGKGSARRYFRCSYDSTRSNTDVSLSVTLTGDVNEYYRIYSKHCGDVGTAWCYKEWIIQPPVMFEVVEIIKFGSDMAIPAFERRRRIQFGNDDIKHYRPIVVSRFNVFILSHTTTILKN